MEEHTRSVRRGALRLSFGKSPARLRGSGRLLAEVVEELAVGRPIRSAASSPRGHSDPAVVSVESDPGTDDDRCSDPTRPERST